MKTGTLCYDCSCRAYYIIIEETSDKSVVNRALDFDSGWGNDQQTLFVGFRTKYPAYKIEKLYEPE